MSAPLAEIAPQAIHPVLGCTIGELLATLPDAGQNRVSEVGVLPELNTDSFKVTNGVRNRSVQNQHEELEVASCSHC